MTLTELNPNGVVLFVLWLVGGFALGVRATNRTRTMAVASVLLALTAVGRVLSAIILRVDPRRDTGTVPLPEPLASLASWTAIALLFLAPAVGGWLIGRAPRIGVRDARDAPVSITLAAIVAYAIYITPWILGVVLD